MRDPRALFSARSLPAPLRSGLKVALSLALGLGLGLGGAAPRSAAQSSDDGAQPFVGQWRYVSGEEGERRVHAAVDEVVEGLAFFKQPIAESQVEARVGPFQRLTFRMRGERLLFEADDWGPVGSPLDAPPTTVPGPAGSDLRLTQRVSPQGYLHQVFRHQDATRQNQLSLSQDGDLLTLQTRLSGSALSGSATYLLRYRRVGD